MILNLISSIFLFLCIILIIYFIIKYAKSKLKSKLDYKINRPAYYDKNYVNYNLNKYINMENFNKIDYFNQKNQSNYFNSNSYLFQTYHNKNKIPIEVFDNIKKYAPEYVHFVLDDNDIKQFLQTYYTKSVYDTFNNLKLGAHKADLARYCLLYIYGGIYLDIKVELIKPITKVFSKGDDIFYSVLADDDTHVHQAIIKSFPKNPLFLSLIDYIVKTNNPEIYLDFCIDLYKQIAKNIGKINEGLNIDFNTNFKYYFFRENCSKDKSKCYDGLDRYGRCCYIMENNISVIKGRRASYPW